MSLPHGMSASPEYDAWRSMKQRCLNPKHDQYAQYGGKGISICEKWMTFAGFYADMGPRPDGTNLVRIDKRCDYDATNCKWAPQSQVYDDDPTVKRLTYDGRTQSISQWADELGLDRLVLHQRVCRGWPVEKALKTPIRKYVQRKTPHV